jgi:hypothetical protein
MDAQYTTFSRKQVFASRKGWTAGLLLWGTIAVLLTTIFIPVLLYDSKDLPWLAIIILALLFILLSWIWFGTYYTLTPEYLKYNSGPIRGSIPLSSIIWVKHQHTLWSGLRVSLAYNGLLIRYNKYDEIYISPADKAAFIYTLQQYNPNVKVKLENED